MLRNKLLLLFIISVPVSLIRLGKGLLNSSRSIGGSSNCSGLIAIYGLADGFNGVSFGWIAASICILLCFHQVIEIRFDHLLRISTLLHEGFSKIIHTRFLLHQLFILVNDLDPRHNIWLLLLRFDVGIAI